MAQKFHVFSITVDMGRTAGENLTVKQVGSDLMNAVRRVEKTYGKSSVISAVRTDV